jgi:hypothetical protein
MALTPEYEQILSLIDQARENKYLRVETVRRLAGTEENYRIIIRELDRVKAQLMYARTGNAPATLTVTEWFTILDRFEWKCAYCRNKPFQAMSHVSPQRERGTTAENCVPACHSCISKPNKKISLPEKEQPKQDEAS